MLGLAVRYLFSSISRHVGGCFWPGLCGLCFPFIFTLAFTLHPGIWQVFFPNDYIDLYGASVCSWQHAGCLAVYQAQGSSIVVNLLCSAVLYWCIWANEPQKYLSPPRVCLS